jgi:hypothetical protein
MNKKVEAFVFYCLLMTIGFPKSPRMASLPLDAVVCGHPQ